MTAGSVAGEFDAATLARWAARLAILSPRAVWASRVDLVHLDVAVIRTSAPPADPLISHAVPADIGSLGPLIERLWHRGGFLRYAGGWAQRGRERFTFASGRVIPWERVPGTTAPPAFTVHVADIEAYLAGPRWPQHTDVLAVERPQPGIAPVAAWQQIAVAHSESVAIVLAELSTGWRGYAAGDTLEPALSLDDPKQAFPNFPAGWQRA
ncbi:MAG: hypothetical protein U0746_08705 [Gemmataceae bacterium]